MIDYEWGYCGLGFIFRLDGSVFPKALLFAFPNAILAFTLSTFFRERLGMDGLEILWSGYTFVLGFLVVFRTNQAYNRFWEGATLMQQVRGEWFNAVSSVIAFCDPEEERREEVEHMQQLLVRLMSMLYCAALQQVCDLQDDSLEIIDAEGIDETSLNFMADAPDRCEVILQWIQRLIADGQRRSLISMPPPIISRAYQELSRGIVNLIDIRKIRDIPFPFPYAQMIGVMLAVHWCVTPLLASQVVLTREWAAMVCFCVTAVIWALVFIAAEIDQPFGEDPNDLAVAEMQKDMNLSLLTLLEPLAQTTPNFTWFQEEILPLAENWTIEDPAGYRIREDDRLTSQERTERASLKINISQDQTDLGAVGATTRVKRSSLESFSPRQSTASSMSRMSTHSGVEKKMSLPMVDEGDAPRRDSFAPSANRLSLMQTQKRTSLMVGHKSSGGDKGPILIGKKSPAEAALLEGEQTKRQSRIDPLEAVVNGWRDEDKDVPEDSARTAERAKTDPPELLSVLRTSAPAKASLPSKPATGNGDMPHFKRTASLKMTGTSSLSTRSEKRLNKALSKKLTFELKDTSMKRPSERKREWRNATSSDSTNFKHVFGRSQSSAGLSRQTSPDSNDEVILLDEEPQRKSAAGLAPIVSDSSRDSDTDQDADDDTRHCSLDRVA